jgi:hypothetical protein
MSLTHRPFDPPAQYLPAMVQLAKQQTPLGWEASVRISPQGVSPWRYLVGFPHDGAPTSFIDSFLTAQAMPTAFKDAFAACLPWTASILFSVAPSRSDTELRVYQEYAAEAASDVAMRGFKWPAAARSGVLGPEGARMTNYSASPATAFSAEVADYPQELQAFLHATLRWQRTSLDATQNRSLSSSAVLRSTERQGARDALSLRFTYMQQALSVCVAEVRLLALNCGYSVSALSQLDDMLHQVSDRLLNWVSVGLDTQGLPFISLYFTATEDDVLVAASHSHRRAA